MEKPPLRAAWPHDNPNQSEAGERRGCPNRWSSLLLARLARRIAGIARRLLLGFQGDLDGVQQQALPDVNSYLSFIMQFLFGFGLSFLLPVLLMLLERAGIVTRKQLIGARRYAIVGAFAIAAVLTPPDVGSQLLLAIPLVLLYELALIGIWFTEKRRKNEAPEAESTPAG